MVNTIPRLIKKSSEDFAELAAQMSRNEKGLFVSTTFKELFDQAGTFGAGLDSLGVKKGTPVGLISDNRREWLVADLGILGIGAVDVPRGRDTLDHELIHILGFPGCPVVIIENLELLSRLEAIIGDLPAIKKVILLDSRIKKDEVNWKVKKIELLLFGEVMEKGQKTKDKDPEFFEKSIQEVEPGDLATIIFTSGTTGKPKGVQLSHENFIHQLRAVPEVIDIKPADIWLSVLPVWHVFERIAEYIAILTGSTLAYSKPIGKIMLTDFASVRPMWMASVPRIWESIKVGVYRNVNEAGGISKILFHFFAAVGKSYTNLKAMFTGALPQFKKRNRFIDVLLSIFPLIFLWPWNALGSLLVFSKIRKKLGGRFKAGVSGGGSLPEEIDLFFHAAGIKLLNGYGLTETAPVLGIRNYYRSVLFSMAPLPGTELKIIDEKGEECAPGVRGELIARGKQVMLGYYKDPEATKAILREDGFIKTGDLAEWTHRGNFTIRGRAKDTIVLLGGENVEPGPIETKLRESNFVDQAMVVGQDQKFLGAIIQPDLKEVEKYMKSHGVSYISRSDLIKMEEVKDLLGSEISELINAKTGYRPFERIIRFGLVEKSFEIGEELSAKQEIKRHKITEKYAKQIDDLFR